MAKKYQKKKIGGVEQAVPNRKDHNRPPMPPPAQVHKSKKHYDRKQQKQEDRKQMM